MKTSYQTPGTTFGDLRYGAFFALAADIDISTTPCVYRKLQLRDAHGKMVAAPISGGYGAEFFQSYTRVRELEVEFVVAPLTPDAVQLKLLKEGDSFWYAGNYYLFTDRGTEAHQDGCTAFNLDTRMSMYFDPDTLVTPADTTLHITKLECGK